MAKKKKKKFDDEGLSSEDLKKQHEKMKSRSKKRGKGIFIDDIMRFIPKEGENCIRILQPPEWEKIKYYGFPLHHHTEVGPDDSWLICNIRMQEDLELIGMEGILKTDVCLHCEEQKNIWDEDEELAKTYYPSERRLIWVLDLYADGETEGEILLWNCAKSLAEEILGQSHKKGSDVYVDVSNPKTGRAVYFDRIGKGLKTKYKNIQIGDDEVPIDSDLADEMQEFEDILVFADEEEQRAMMEGRSVDKDDDDSDSAGDEDEQPDCFGKEYDEYEDCDTCTFAQDCKETKEGGGKKKKKKKEEQPPDCFGKEYDEYEDCDDCSFKDECKEAMEGGGKKKKKKKDASEDKTDSVKDKLKQSLAKRKAKKGK